MARHDNISRLSSRVRSVGVLATLLAAVLASACEKLGYTDRVLHRVPSPDGRMVAVCQEVPQFDGPNYAIRLERPDGSLIRALYEIGDGDPCSEIAWAPDGKTLGVLSAHVARIRFVDVRWALDNPTIETTHHSWRAVDAPGISGVVLAKHLRFTSRSTVEFQLCSGAPESVPGNNVAPCTPPRAVEIPQPIFNAAAHRTARR